MKIGCAAFSDYRRPSVGVPNYGLSKGAISSVMKKSDVMCARCNAGYRRIELATRSGKSGEFRCLICNHLLESFDGTSEVALGLTVQPARYKNDGDNRFSN